MADDAEAGIPAVNHRPDEPLVHLAPLSIARARARRCFSVASAAERQALWLTVPMALFYVGFSCFGSTFPFAMLTVACEGLYPADRCAAQSHTAAGALTMEERAHFNAAASRWGVVLTFCAFAPTVLSVSFLMSRSEVVGRKPVVLFAILTATVLYASVASWYTLGLRNEVLVPIFLLYGSGGSFATVNAAFYSMVADLLPAGRRRTKAYGQLMASSTLGSMLGPPLGGALHHATGGFTMSMVAPLGFAIAAAAFVVGAPESRHGANLSKALSGEGVLRTVRRSYVDAYSLIFGRSGYAGAPAGAEAGAGSTARSSVGAWCLLFFLVFTCSLEAEARFAYYLPLRFGFGQEMFSLFTTSQRVSKVVATTTLLPLYLRWRADADPSASMLFAIRCCVAWLCVCIFAYGLAPSAPLLWAATLLEGPAVCAFPLMRSLLSASVRTAQQGALQGLIANLETLTLLTVDFAFGAIYAATVEWCAPPRRRLDAPTRLPDPPARPAGTRRSASSSWARSPSPPSSTRSRCAPRPATTPPSRPAPPPPSAARASASGRGTCPS